MQLYKWTLKFKLLYMLNHISYFNKICKDMLPEYSHTKYKSLAQITTPIAEIQIFF